jgi:hypothetical protein
VILRKVKGVLNANFVPAYQQDNRAVLNGVKRRFPPFCFDAGHCPQTMANDLAQNHFSLLLNLSECCARRLSKVPASSFTYDEASPYFLHLQAVLLTSLSTQTLVVRDFVL